KMTRRVDLFSKPSSTARFAQPLDFSFCKIHVGVGCRKAPLRALRPASGVFRVKSNGRRRETNRRDMYIPSGNETRKKSSRRGSARRGVDDIQHRH
ncbi:hypothetical protein ALC57_02834, partial [Trachymyrmex cornetzi]